MKRDVFLLAVVLFLGGIGDFQNTIQAQSSTELQIETLEIRDQRPTNTPTPIPKPSPLLFAPEQKSVFESQGYIIQSPADRSDFYRYTISRSSLRFGEVEENSTVEQSFDIFIRSSRSMKYQILLYQRGSFKNRQKQIIIPTKCDSAQNPCTIQQAQPWENIESFGYGYNISGRSVPVDFRDETYFRPFADISRSENPVIINQGLSEDTPVQITTNVKIQYPERQAIGTYQTDISVISIPRF